MKTYEHRDADGRLISFEIDNWWVQRREATRIIQLVPGARLVPRSEWTSERYDGEFCKIRVGEVAVVIEEPFDDNSRYLVSARPAGPAKELEEVHAVFARYEPKAWFSATRLLANVLMGVGLAVLATRVILPSFAPRSTVGVGLAVAGGSVLAVLFVASQFGLTGQVRPPSRASARDEGSG